MYIQVIHVHCKLRGQVHRLQHHLKNGCGDRSLYEKAYGATSAEQALGHKTSKMSPPTRLHTWRGMVLLANMLHARPWSQ